MLVLRWRERKAHLIYKPKNKDFESISQNRNSLKIQIDFIFVTPSVPICSDINPETYLKFFDVSKGRALPVQ